MVVAASAIGVAFLLTVWGIAVDQLGDNTAFERRQIVYLIAGTVLMVALPVLALLATVGRLSAAVRDKRLANLRLLGMSATQTRTVAGTEVGTASVCGTVLGAALHPLVAAIVPSGAVAPWPAWVAVLVAVPVSVVLIALLPQRRSSADALAESRRAEVRRVGLWRVGILLAGLVSCGLAQLNMRLVLTGGAPENPALTLLLLFGGVSLVGLGVLVVVPVFVRLIAAVVLRLGRGPRATLLGRRLQDQPAAMTRVVSTLMLGLFVVMMSRAVLGAFLATSQYQAAALQVEYDQTSEITVPVGEADAMRQRLSALDAVDRIGEFPVLSATVGGDPGYGVLVARCADLRDGGHPLAHCSDTRVNQVNFVWTPSGPAPTTVAVQATDGWQPQGPMVDVPVDGSAPMLDGDAFHRATGAFQDQPTLVVSPDLPGVAELVKEGSVVLVPHAGPGTDLYAQLDAAGIRYDVMIDLENYYFVNGMQRLVWVLAATVLSLGLLAFTVASVDRTVARRRELTALRLVGTPVRVLRQVQWLEAMLPTALGSLVALGAGAYAGMTYLSLDDRIGFPTWPAVGLMAAAVLISALLAAITVAGTSARLDAEHIRTA